MKKFRAHYHVETEAQIKGEEPYNRISESEIVEAEDAGCALDYVAQWLSEQAAEDDRVAYTQVSGIFVLCYNDEDECIERYEIYDVDEM